MCFWHGLLANVCLVVEIQLWWVLKSQKSTYSMETILFFEIFHVFAPDACERQQVEVVLAWVIYHGTWSLEIMKVPTLNVSYYAPFLRVVERSEEGYHP